MYRYRDNGGSTRLSIERAKNHLHKVGEIIEIRGYVYKGRYDNNYCAVLVKGDKGTARFSGFAWGYQGEGPRGLKLFLESIKVDQEEISQILSSEWGDSPKIVWQITV